MGYFNHRALIVTGFDDDDVTEARAKAVEIYERHRAGMICGPTTLAPITEVVAAPINGGGSFAILPDGSKEGWDHSDKSDLARDEFVAWIEREDCFLDFVEVRFGGDGPSGLLRTSNDRPVR